MLFFQTFQNLTRVSVTFHNSFVEILVLKSLCKTILITSMKNWYVESCFTIHLVKYYKALFVGFILMSNYPCMQNINQPHIFVISACQGKEADIVFLVDCSSSIWLPDYNSSQTSWAILTSSQEKHRYRNVFFKHSVKIEVFRYFFSTIFYF